MSNFHDDRKWTKKQMQVIFEYSRRLDDGMLLNYLKRDLTAEQAIERLEQALKDDKMISRKDKSFYQEEF